MTVTGSDCRYGFCWRGESSKLYVFEAAIDLMSFVTLRNDEWKADSFLALDGLSSKPLLQFLEDQKISMRFFSVWITMWQVLKLVIN